MGLSKYDELLGRLVFGGVAVFAVPVGGILAGEYEAFSKGFFEVFAFAIVLIVAVVFAGEEGV